MGWSGGTDVMWGIINAFDEIELPEEVRVQFYRAAIAALEQRDWDCADECRDQGVPAFDEALELNRRAWCKKKRYSYEEFFEEEDDDD